MGCLIEIGHDVKIGKHCKIVSQTGICGGARLGDYVHIYGQSGVAENISIGAGAIVMARSGVTKNIDPGAVVSGLYARDHTEELKMWHRIRKFLGGK